MVGSAFSVGVVTARVLFIEQGWTEPLNCHRYPLDYHRYPLVYPCYPLDYRRYPLHYGGYPLIYRRYPLHYDGYPLVYRRYPLHSAASAPKHPTIVTRQLTPRFRKSTKPLLNHPPIDIYLI